MSIGITCVYSVFVMFIYYSNLKLISCSMYYRELHNSHLTKLTPMQINVSVPAESTSWPGPGLTTMMT